MLEKKIVVACEQINRKKIPDPHNAKEHYGSFIRNKNTKSVNNQK